MSVFDAERGFFSALVNADADALETILSDDFVIIDVLSGSEVERDAFLDAVRSGVVVFDTIVRSATRVRTHGTTSIVTGQTEMAGRCTGEPFSARSRYTHVYASHDGRLRLVSAQGTKVSGPPPA